MKTTLGANWLLWQGKVNSLSVRERMIITGALAVLMLGIFDQVFLRPWLQERTALTAQEQKLKADTDQLSNQLSELENRLANDPNKRLRESIAQLTERNQQLDGEISAITDGMIAPELMPSLLGKLLSERSGLKLQSIKTQPATRLISVDKDRQDAPAIYRHDLELRLQGNFEQVQRYLSSIEELPQKLVWDELTFSVEHYPQGDLQVAVHTLSAHEELIRVHQ